MNIVRELTKLSTSLPPKAPPIPVALSDLGQVGHVSARQGLYINSGVRHHVRNLIADHYRAERAARELTSGRLGAEALLPIIARGSDSRDAIRAIKSLRGAITSWDGVIAARGNGKYFDFQGTKASQTTVANQWSSFLRTAGVPGAMTFNNIPGPAALDAATAGAWPLPMALGATDFLYLTNVGTNHATGTNIVLLADVVQAAGNINANSNTTQLVSTTQNLRWTGGSGLMMTLEITGALGATAANVTLSYVNQAGSAGTTAAIAMTTSGIAGRLQPVQDGPAIRLATGDYGVRSIATAIFSAAMGGGTLAALIYKPLLLVPTLATTSFVERSTPAQIGGIKALTEVAQGSKAALGFLVLCSTTATGVQLYMLETVWG